MKYALTLISLSVQGVVSFAFKSFKLREVLILKERSWFSIKRSLFVSPSYTEQTL